MIINRNLRIITSPLIPSNRKRHIRIRLDFLSLRKPLQPLIKPTSITSQLNQRLSSLKLRTRINTTVMSTVQNIPTNLRDMYCPE